MNLLLNHRILTGTVLVLCLGVLMPSISQPAQAAEKLVFAAAANTVDTLTSEIIVREAYRRLGIEVQIRKYPGERALKLANSGKVDGDVQRINGLSGKYQNLIQLRPAINYIEAAAFSRDTAIGINGWDSLRPYSLGIIRGIKFAENNTKGMRTYAAKNYAGLFRMLEGKRVELAISPSLNGRYQMTILGIKGIKELRPSISRFDLFHYIHKKRENLKPKLEMIFRQMKASGALSRIRQHVITVLLARAGEGQGICDKDYKCFEQGLDLTVPK